MLKRFYASVHVVGKSEFQSVLELVKNNCFSLLIDESTDLSANKHLDLVIEVCNILKINDTFYVCCLQLKVAPTAQQIYNVITNFFKEHYVDYKTKMIDFEADGCNIRMESRQSLQIILKNDVLYILVMKFMCHSLAFSAEYAAYCTLGTRRYEVTGKKHL